MLSQLNVARQRVALLLGIALLAGTLVACDDPLKPVIARIQEAITTIQAESQAWRDELDKLSTDLTSMEDTLSGDVQQTVTNATNDVDRMAKEAVAMSDQTAEGLIAQAGVEARCDFNFVKRTVTDELHYLAADLSFWEKNHAHTTPPAHGTCWVDPGAVSLYQTDGGPWAAETGNMQDQKPFINLYGYNFRSDALPQVDLRRADGTLVKSDYLTPTYRTSYVIALDLSAGLSDLPANEELVLNWPDDSQHADATTISLLRTSAAKLVLSDPVFTPPDPTAGQDQVVLRVKVSNTGMRASDAFDVEWTPEPGATTHPRVHHAPLAGGTSDVVAFQAHQFAASGDIFSNVTTGAGLSEAYLLHVKPPPPPPAKPERNYGSGDNNPENDYPRDDERQGNVWGGYGKDLLYGGPCAPGYVRANQRLDVTQVTHDKHRVYATASSDWADGDPHDCHVKVHYSIEASGTLDHTNSIDVTVYITERGQ